MATVSESVPLWGRWEAAFTGSTFAPPCLSFAVDFTSPSGASLRRPGFWDGAATWRVRFMPTETGRWTWRTLTIGRDTGLDGHTGWFECVPPTEFANVFHRRGRIQVAPNGHHLQHADRTPFLFLADTAWNGPLLSSDADWDEYLRDRVAKRFTAVQFIVLAPWAAAYSNAEGEIAWTGRDEFPINPHFFQQMDRRIDAINAAGLLAVPVLLWAANFGSSSRYNPGSALPEHQRVMLAEYQVARYGANHVMWVLAGDGKYGGLRSRAWKRIGRAVFGHADHAPVALHPMGGHWPYESFRDEKWLDVAGYQTSHSDDDRTLRFTHSGPAASAPRRPPTRPVINFEPCYEGIRNFNTRPPRPFEAHGVRQAVYRSLLNAPTAGVSYGAHGVWSWEDTAREPLNHAGTGVAKPWREAMAFPGAEDMKRVAELFGSIEWWRLRPAPELLAAQPGGKDPALFLSATRTDDGRAVIVYLPVGGKVALREGAIAADARIEWFDPRTGERTPATPVGAAFDAADKMDWVLVVRSA